MKQNYFCSLCGQSFGRKSNGNRHNDNIHQGTANITNTKDIMAQEFSSFQSPSCKDINKHNPLVWERFNKQESETVNTYLRRVIESKYFGIEYAHFNKILNIVDKKIEKELYKIAPSFSKAAQILSHIEGEEKGRILGYMVADSLTSKDPVGRMTELTRNCQNTVTICSIIKSIALLYKNDPTLIKALLQVISLKE